MIRLYILVTLCLCVYVFLHSRWFHWLKQGGSGKGLPPKKGTMTMFDVRQLLLKGEKDLAVRVYSEIFKVDSAEARAAVEEIERSIQSKDFEA